MVLPDAHVAAHAREGGRRDRRGQPDGGAELCQYRRVDPRTEHVRSCAGSVAGRQLEGVVGGGAAVPHHVPVFVLTHHARRPIVMKGGTEFRFVTEGIHAALEQAKAAAGEQDIRLGGGVATIRQYLNARLIDELHLVVRPVLLGAGEHLLNGINMRALGYACAETIHGERATHVILRKVA